MSLAGLLSRSLSTLSFGSFFCLLGVNLFAMRCAQRSDSLDRRLPCWPEPGSWRRLASMSSTPAPDFEAVLEQARRLPEDQRLRLVEALQVQDDDLDPELRAELVRRAQSLRDGTATLYDLVEVEREVRLLLEP